MTAVPTPHLRPLAPAVYSTLLGSAALEASADTEADPAAVLLHLLAGVGAAIGTGAYADWSGRHTPARLFGLVIGGTGGGKGIAEHVALRLLRGAVPEWCDDGIAGGLVSGEGLLAALGGEPAPEPGFDDGPPLPRLVTPTDHALLVVEPEFGRVLAAAGREGATLSHLLRELWDKDTAASLSRQRPLRVKRAHLSMVGHITPTELRRLADTNAIENGLLNRFLPIAVTRGALQPFGTPPSSEAAARRRTNEAAVREAVEYGRKAGRIDLHPDAHDRWIELYGALAPERPFVLGALTARAIAHVQRVALLLALGDGDTYVRTLHLDAAAAIWERAQAAWADLYGDVLGDKLAERLLAALTEAAQDGLTRAEIRSVVGSNNVPAARITGALEVLRTAGYASMTKVAGPSGGRPAELWIATAAHGSDGNEANAAPAASLRAHSSHLSHPSHASRPAVADAA